MLNRESKWFFTTPNTTYMDANNRCDEFVWLTYRQCWSNPTRSHMFVTDDFGNLTEGINKHALLR